MRHLVPSAPVSLALALLAAPAMPLAAHAQQAEAYGQTLQTPMETTASQHPVSFVALPIPISNPALGNGLGVGAMALYSPAGSPRPWTTGFGGLYTDSPSWAVFAFQKAYIGDDKIRITVGGGTGDFNVDFFGIGQAAGAAGQSIGLDQKATFGGGSVLFLVASHIHVGLLFRGVAMDTTVKTSEIHIADLMISDIELKSTIAQLGLGFEYDSRDNEYNPRKGILAQVQWFDASGAFGSDFDYERFTAAINGYHRLDDKSLLAWRGSLCWTGDGGPFYDLCSFGQNNDLRGYVAGQYRDHGMFAVQGEYRRQISHRWGMVAFAGVGEVAPDITSFNTKNLLPAAGVGVRFMASEKYKVNVGTDFAVGSHSSAFYFAIGEAF